MSYPFPANKNKRTEISKIQDGGGRHLDKSKNRHISAAVWAIATKFGAMTQFDTLDRSIAPRVWKTNNVRNEHKPIIRLRICTAYTDYISSTLM